MSTDMTGLPTIRSYDFGGEPAWELVRPDGGRILVAELGATILSWSVPGPAGEAVELIDGYCSAAELREYNGYRGAVLAPWSNRIAGGTYRFGPEKFTLECNDAAGALHGLAYNVRWQRDLSSHSVLALRAELPASEGYPWPLTLKALFSCEEGSHGDERLGITLEAVNNSDRPAPVGLGWHPYVTIPGVDRVDDLSVKIPARTRVLTDRNLIPLPGDAAYAGETSPVRYSPIGDTALDTAFTELITDEDGVVASRILAPSGGSITLEQVRDTASVVHLFTGDGLAARARQSIAMEACSFVTNAFNRPDAAAAGLALGPGEARQLVCDLVYRS